MMVSTSIEGKTQAMGDRLAPGKPCPLRRGASLKSWKSLLDKGMMNVGAAGDPISRKALKQKYNKCPLIARRNKALLAPDMEDTDI
jgi:hypothetical protein